MAPQRSSRRPGESAPFHFETTWRTTAPPQQVWDILADISHWPTWWPGLRAAQVLPGQHARLTVQGPLGVRLRFAVALVAAEAPSRAELEVTGELRGTGRVRIRREDDQTLTTITWRVVTGHRILGALRPLASWSHSTVMAAGQRGLLRECGQPGHSVAPTAVRPRVVLAAGAAALPLIICGLLGQRLWRTRRDHGGPVDRDSHGQP